MPIPALTVKATIFFGMGGNGWTESFWWQGQSSDLTAQGTVLKAIVNKRRVLLGAQASIRAYRVSFEAGAGGELVLQDAELNYYGQNGYSTEPSSAPDDALLLNWKDGTGQRNKFQFLRGVWRNIINPAGAYVPGYGNWQTQYSAWLSQLNLGVSGVKAPSVGWIRRTPRYKSVITRYVSDANGYVTLTLDPAIPQGVGNPPVGGMLYGVPLEARCTKLNTKSPLNGQLLVTLLNGTTAVTVKPVATIPFKTSGFLTFYDTSLLLCGTDPTTGQIKIKDQKIVERKVGAPLLESRGRQRARVRA